MKVIKQNADGVCQRDTGTIWKISQGQKLELFEQQIHKIVLDYNLSYNINIHESIVV